MTHRQPQGRRIYCACREVVVMVAATMAAAAMARVAASSGPQTT